MSEISYQESLEFAGMDEDMKEDINIPKGWVICSKKDYYSLPEGKRAFLDGAWRCGPLPRSCRDIMEGNESSLNFVTIKMKDIK